MSQLWASTLYSARTREPLVQLRHQDWVVQVSPSEAREFARNIFECAEASEQDAFLVDWIQKTINVKEEQAAMVLAKYREWRKAKAEGKE